MALRIEAHYSKEDILVAYLNEVYLGQDGARAIHGFGLASEYYFAKPLAELDPGELALLIGLVKGPSYYDPRKHPDRARTRRNLVLQQLADANLIDSATAKRAAANPLGLRPPGGSYVPAYLDLVRRHLKRDYAEADLAAAGLGVYTSLDEFRGTPYMQTDLRVTRPFKIGERVQINPFAEFFNLFNRNNPGANFAVNVAQLPIPAAQMMPNAQGITNVTSICTVPDCSQIVPITSLKQLEIPEGALGDFFGPGTTVGIPFAAQLGVRVTF